MRSAPEIFSGQRRAQQPAGPDERLAIDQRKRRVLIRFSKFEIFFGQDDVIDVRSDDVTALTQDSERENCIDRTGEGDDIDWDFPDSKALGR